MPEHSGVCGGCAERGCVPLPGQGVVLNHPPPTTHPPSLGHGIHIPGVTPPDLDHGTHLPGVVPPHHPF